MNLSKKHLNERGWLEIAEDPQMRLWVRAVREEAVRISANDANKKAWLRHANTWFAGVDVLENDEGGRFKGLELGQNAQNAINQLGYAGLPFHPAQISITYPGYPKYDGTESETAFAYRRKRFGAHIDGLLPVGLTRQRFLKEPHAYILGIPLTQTTKEAAPLMVWEGSAAIMRAHFQSALGDVAPEKWSMVNITEVYHQARRACFQECKLRALHARPGGAYIVHRLSLHGIGVWGDGAKAPPEGRMIAYFRPQLPEISQWLDE